MIWYRILSIMLLSTFVAADSTESTTPTTTIRSTTVRSTSVRNRNPQNGETTTLRTTTTLDPISEQDKAVTEKLLDILETYSKGEAHGNNELKSWLKLVKEASKWTKNRMVEKGQVVVMFNQYDSQRKDLEEHINDRLETLVDDLIPSQKPYSQCWKFYMRQRNVLRKALKKSNAKKSLAIQQNSVPCKEEDSSEEDDY